MRNAGDVKLFREALKFSGIDAEVSHFPDGITAVAKLESKEHACNPPPDIVFLDLKMPRLSGFDVLITMARPKPS